MKTYTPMKTEAHGNLSYSEAVGEEENNAQGEVGTIMDVVGHWILGIPDSHQWPTGHGVPTLVLE